MQVKAELTTSPNSSTGSPSGSDVYPQPGHSVLGTLTPSPSPPAINITFVHYSPGSNSCQQYSATSSSFYSVPSSLSDALVLNIPHEMGHPMHEQHSTQLALLGQVAHPQCSQRCEKDNDREHLPTPVSTVSPAGVCPDISMRSLFFGPPVFDCISISFIPATLQGSGE